MTPQASGHLNALGTRLAKVQNRTKHMTFYSGLLATGLRENLIQRAEANAVLTRAMDDGLEPLGAAINAALHRRVIDLIESSPFPLHGRSRDDLELPDFGVIYDTTIVHSWGNWYDHDLSAMLHLSPEVRVWVWNALNEAPIPCIDALSVYDAWYMGDGIGDVMHKLAKAPTDPTDETLSDEFAELLKDGNCDETEEGEPYHYTFGRLDEYSERVRSLLPVYRRRLELLPECKKGAPIPKPRDDIEARWLDFGSRLKKLRTWLGRKRIKFHFESDEQKPIHLANVIALDKGEFAIVHEFWDRADDQSGEVPGVSMRLGDTTEEGAGLVSFALFPVLIASVFGELNSLCAETMKCSTATST